MAERRPTICTNKNSSCSRADKTANILVKTVQFISSSSSSSFTTQEAAHKIHTHKKLTLKHTTMNVVK